MKMFVVICLFAALSLSYARPELYTDKFDNTNVKEVLENPRLFEGYMKCILDQGSCTSEGKELKAHIKEALETDCLKCTDAQKKMVAESLTFIINKEKVYWEKICAKFDPERKLKPVYEKRYLQA